LQLASSFFALNFIRSVGWSNLGAGVLELACSPSSEKFYGENRWSDCVAMMAKLWRLLLRS
jgi:hypothetical protein